MGFFIVGIGIGIGELLLPALSRSFCQREMERRIFQQSVYTRHDVPWICRHAVSSKGVDTTLPSLGPSRDYRDSEKSHWHC
ncbi:hypothetical protein EI94DRAFT_719400 [Lactarius quietus]|nr:hypothetical protein EI94DRAFT_719400 [Lactarius quietus]